MEKILYIVTGCTGTGKTEEALRWAEAHDAEIVSCDSMLFYRGMDIGTAKPTPEERARVPHHLIDVAPVSEPFSVGRYVTLAARTVRDIAARGRRVMVVGGSGFYLKSFLEPVVDDVAPGPEVRARVVAWERDGGLERLAEELLRLNPEGVGALDLNNPRRVARALERCLASGRTLAELEAAFRERPEPFSEFEKRACILEREPAALVQRIATRAEAMIRKGLVDEVRHLRDLGLERNPTAARAIGYREVLAFLAGDGKQSGRELAAEIAANTQKLVKKQRTWFRHQLAGARRVVAGEEELFED